MKLTFIGALQIALIVMKLCGAIDWNWWLVCIPAIASSFFSIVIFMIGFIEEWNRQNRLRRLRAKR